MSRLLTEMMHNYFEEAEADRPGSPTPWSRPFEVPSVKLSATPIRPTAKSEWQMGKTPRCLKKSFEFTKPQVMAAFVQELMSYEVETGHHGKLVCEYPYVDIEVRTHDLDDVTELDQVYAKTCDQIYQDVKYYGSGRDDGSTW